MTLPYPNQVCFRTVEFIISTGLIILWSTTLSLALIHTCLTNCFFKENKPESILAQVALPGQGQLWAAREDAELHGPEVKMTIPKRGLQVQDLTAKQSNHSWGPLSTAREATHSTPANEQLAAKAQIYNPTHHSCSLRDFGNCWSRVRPRAHVLTIKQKFFKMKLLPPIR